jgi:S1-C subfamily serine protease
MSMTIKWTSTPAPPLSGAILLLLLITGCSAIGFGDPSRPPAAPDATSSASAQAGTEPGATSSASAQAGTEPGATSSASAQPEAPRTWAALIEEVRSGVGQMSVTTCENSFTGTGFLIEPDLIVTAAHVVEDASAISVSFDGLSINGVVLGINELADLALVRTESEVSGHQFQFAAAEPAIGTEVAAVGFPLGDDLTLTRGIVSGLNREIDFGAGVIGNMLQTDTAINPGNSGGPLLAQDGAVTGVVSATHRDAEGMAYAVTAPRAADAMREWQSRGVPLTPIECGNAPAPDEGYFPLTVASNHDQANNIGQSLLLHGQGINQGAYRAAFKQFTPEMQAGFGSSDVWSAELGSSYWRAIEVVDVTGTGDALSADVNLRTIQDPEHGRQGQSCSDWRLRYSMEWDGSAWRIAGSSLPSGDPVSCD